MKQSFLFFYITCPDQNAAESLSALLLQEKAAACINIIPGMKSLYWWENKIQSSEEVILIAKTTLLHKGKLVELVRKNHPYETPCIAEIKIESLNKEYEEWLLKSLN